MSDLALHAVIIAAYNHRRENLLLDAVSPEPMQHRIAPLWNALQQDLHNELETGSATRACCTPVDQLWRALATGRGKGLPGQHRPPAAFHTRIY